MTTDTLGRVREPFMPTAALTDDMLINTGTETITWGEFRRRKNLTTREPSEADVERVARALSTEQLGGIDMYDDKPEWGKDRWRGYARAALAAMAPGSGGVGEDK
jgi:hypothetical protein